MLTEAIGVEAEAVDEIAASTSLTNTNNEIIYNEQRTGNQFFTMSRQLILISNSKLLFTQWKEMKSLTDVIKQF